MKAFLQKFLVTLVTGTSLLTLYLLINHAPGNDHVPVTMPEWVPFWPGLALPYLLMLILPLFLQSLIQDKVRFRQALLSVIIGFTMIASIWMLFPTEMARPPVAHQTDGMVYRFLAGVDRPVNIFPCGHVLWPVVSIYFLGRERRRWLKFLIPLLLFGVVAIVTTWQHRPVDVLAGMILSAGAIFLATRTR